MTTKPPKSVSRLATVKEVASIYRVSEKTVYRWVERREVQVKRAARRSCIRIVVDEDDPSGPSVRDR